jgi:RNA 2',3'-cyclic 3'-phosphodiesterase
VRLFSALWLPEQVRAHLERAVRLVELPAGVRRVPAREWHLTLAFYGNDASLPERAGYLDERLADLATPTLRLVGSGTFDGVLWVGVQPVTAADREALRTLASAAGANRKFRPHVTVARWRLNRPGAWMAEQLAGYRGPTWTASQVDLVRSDPGAPGATATGGASGRYTCVHTVPLAAW